MKKTTLFSLALAAGLALSPSLADAQTKVTLTTAKAVGAEFSFVTNPGKITVDWGDGKAVELSSSGEPIKGELKGQTVIISPENLTFLDCSSNELTQFNVEDALSLRTLYCEDNQLKSLSLDGCRALEDLDCSENDLSSLSTSFLNNLQVLNCAGNALYALSVQSQPKLKTLICSDNKLESISVSQNSALETLWCQNNKLRTLNLSSNKNLQSLVCDDNQISTVNVSGCSQIIDFWCDNNQLKTLDVKNNVDLQTLSCSNNQLTSLNIPAASANKKTKAFYCDGNNLTFTSMHSLSNIENPDNCLYSPQAAFSLPQNTILVGERISIEGFAENADGSNVSPFYTWKNGDVELEKGSKGDYTAIGYRFTFNKPFEAIRCEVTSAGYPGLVLTSTPLAVVDETTGIDDVMKTFGFSYTTNGGVITMKSDKPYQVRIYTVDGKMVWSGTVGTSEKRVSLGHGIFLLNGIKLSI